MDFSFNSLSKLWTFSYQIMFIIYLDIASSIGLEKYLWNPLICKVFKLTPYLVRI